LTAPLLPDSLSVDNTKEVTYEQRREHGIGRAFFIPRGRLVGAGVALLLAPQSGKKTRKQIRELAEDVREQAVEYAEKVKGKVF